MSNRRKVKLVPAAGNQSLPAPPAALEKSESPWQEPVGAAPGESRRHEVWLLGQPPLSEYLDYVGDVVIGGAARRRIELADEWRVANDYYYELEQSEAGIADRVERRDLDPDLAPLSAEVQADPRYRFTFDTLPSRIGVVELDKLVVYQPHVTLEFVEALQARIGPSPDPETLFRFCLPLDRTEAPVRARRVGSRRYVFLSESSDLRFHEPVLLGADQIREYNSFGPVRGVVGLVIGFGGNFLNVVDDGSRLLLNNGYHRACALRAAGVTHVPCVIQSVTRRDELNLTANRDVRENPAFYFKAARPPLLKDFFDPKIRKILPVPKLLRMIEVSFEVKDYEVAE